MIKKLCSVCKSKEVYLKTKSLISGSVAFYCEDCYEKHCEIYIDAQNFIRSQIRTESGKLVGDSIIVKYKHSKWSDQVRELGCIAGMADTGWIDRNENMIKSFKHAKYFADKEEPFNIGDKIALESNNTRVIVIKEVTQEKSCIECNGRLIDYSYKFDELENYNFGRKYDDTLEIKNGKQ